MLFMMHMDVDLCFCLINLCVFHTSSKVSIVWKTNSVSSKGNGTKQSELFLNNLTYQDEGDYKCSVEGVDESKTIVLKIFCKY